MEEETLETIDEFLGLREIHSSSSLSKSYLNIYQEAVKNLLCLYKEEKERNKELSKTLKCTQNSWYEDTQVIEKLKKSITKATEIIDEFADETENDTKKIIEYRKNI